MVEDRAVDPHEGAQQLVAAATLQWFGFRVAADQATELVETPFGKLQKSAAQ